MTSNTPPVETPWFVYILLCSNGAYYTGIARNPAKRLEEHRKGVGGAKYTRSFAPRRIEACWSVSGGRGEALKVEHYIKKSGRKTKEEFIKKPGRLARMVQSELGIRIRKMQVR